MSNNATKNRANNNDKNAVKRRIQQKKSKQIKLAAITKMSPGRFPFSNSKLKGKKSKKTPKGNSQYKVLKNKNNKVNSYKTTKKSIKKQQKSNKLNLVPLSNLSPHKYPFKSIRLVGKKSKKNPNGYSKYKVIKRKKNKN